MREKPTARTPLLSAHRKHCNRNSSGGYVSCEGPGWRCSGTFVLVTTTVLILLGAGHWLALQESNAIHRKVAIVGAGASGAAVAYYLGKAGPQGAFFDTLEIDVFERSSEVGGRCIVVNVPDMGAVGKGSKEVEVGAPGFDRAVDTVFAAIVKELGMEGLLIPGGRWGPIEADYELGIYDGSHLLYRQPHNPKFLWYWWTSLTYFIRYGWAHKNLAELTKSLMPMLSNFKKFFQIYSTTSADYIIPIRLHEAIASPAGHYLESKNIKHPFTKEQVQSRTRARYGANLDMVSAMQAVKVMKEAERERATEMTVRGGLATVFARMIRTTPEAHNTKVQLNLRTEVVGLRKNVSDSGEFVGWTVAYAQRKEEQDGSEPELVMENFDEVVVTGPWNTANLNIQPEETVTDIRWEEVHVTVFTSPRRLAPKAFGLGERDFKGMPPRVLSTLSDGEQRKLGGFSGKDGVGRVGWWSLETVGKVGRRYPWTMEEIQHFSANDTGMRGSDWQLEYVYKIVSPGYINDMTIQKFLEGPRDGAITWIYRHVWDSAFGSPVHRRLQDEEVDVKVDDGLWYTSNMEAIWGSVESAVITGRRVANEISQGWTGARIRMRGTNRLGQL